MPTVYGPQNFRSQKVLVAAKVANVEVKLVEKFPPPADISPLGVSPAYDDGKGVVLFGSDAIARHLTMKNSVYNPQNAEVDQWLSWAEGQLLPNLLAYLLPSVSVVQFSHDHIQRARAEILLQLKHFDAALQKKTFLVGERLTVADVSVALDLLPAFVNVLDTTARKDLVNVTRWAKTVYNQPAVKSVIGDVTFVDTAATFDEAVYKQLTASIVSHKEETPQKKAEKPKAEKSKPKKAEEEQDEADAAVAAEPKFVDPFTSLPGKFDMDAFKRVYSNEDTITKALPYFWEHFEPDNYSIWYCEYKYPEELTQTFMSCNLIGGMFQRLEKLKKHAFGSVCLFGTNNDSTISGVWFWKGQKLAFELSSDWQVDYESYDWKKLDPNNDKTKSLVQHYFTWENFDGKKPFNQGKIFK